ncbi:transposase [Streptomyces sp. NBC_00059]|uniref:IS701 family transposase n=1 Tax=Streptomyces sp. NBC_00059 TaxID=2975635 RepID=UPI0022556296|nr:transposase [Streptomyces sp. NBC_00059]MCX5417791.1 transposase [Streptomyces sp. NBC_00059]
MEMHATSDSPTFPETLAGVPLDLFASLPRSDQRLKAREYVAGLLAAHGRKTLRNVADQFGGEAARKQSVHHFISESSWEWEPIRRGLARHADQLLDPQAWVVRPTVVPKAGGHSVGVGEYFVPALGRSVTGQQSYGAWLASPAAGVPVNWQLVLPAAWVEDGPRRRRAHIPEASRVLSPEENAGDVALRAARSLPGAPRPVVLDAPGLDPLRMGRRFEAAGIPLVQRVDDRIRLRVDPRALPGHGVLPHTPGRLVASLRRLWRPYAPLTAGGRSLTMTVPVTLHEARDGGARETGGERLLVARWPEADLSALRLWLADAGMRPADALRAAALAEVVDRDDALAAARVGLRDFAGRSFQGWHRHITLASVAHLACIRTAGAAADPVAGAAHRDRALARAGRPLLLRAG